MINHGFSRMSYANACAKSMFGTLRQFEQGRALVKSIHVIRGSKEFQEAA